MNEDETMMNPLEFIEVLTAADSDICPPENRDFWLHAIVFGWTDEQYKEFGWDGAVVEEYKRLHEAFLSLKKLRLPLPELLEVSHFTERNTDWQKGWNACVESLFNHDSEEVETSYQPSDSSMSVKDASIGLIGIHKHLTPDEAMSIAVALEALRERDEYRQAAMRMTAVPAVYHDNSSCEGYSNMYCCRHCGKPVYFMQRHCNECGQKLSYPNVRGTSWD